MSASAARPACPLQRGCGCGCGCGQGTNAVPDSHGVAILGCPSHCVVPPAGAPLHVAADHRNGADPELVGQGPAHARGAGPLGGALGWRTGRGRVCHPLRGLKGSRGYRALDPSVVWSQFGPGAHVFRTSTSPLLIPHPRQHWESVAPDRPRHAFDSGTFRNILNDFAPVPPAGPRGVFFGGALAGPRRPKHIFKDFQGQRRTRVAGSAADFLTFGLAEAPAGQRVFLGGALRGQGG